MEPSDPVPDLPPPLRGRFHGLGVLGHGGGGLVLRVRDRQRDQAVALKLLPAHATEAERRRFRREGEALLALSHPNLLKAHEVGEAGGIEFLVTELLEGQSFEQCPDLDPLGGLLEIGEGLAALHRAGLVHRDVKPANCFRTSAGRHVLLDLGLVKGEDASALTEDGARLGSLVFMSPEVLWGQEATPASDWYAWGMSLFALCEGRYPWDLQAIRGALAGGDLPPLEFRSLAADSPQAGLVRACLEARPDRRPPSLAAVERLLEASGTRPTRTRERTARVASAPPPPPPEPCDHLDEVEAPGGPPWALTFGLTALGTAALLYGLRAWLHSG